MANNLRLTSFFWPIHFRFNIRYFGSSSSLSLFLAHIWCGDPIQFSSFGQDFDSLFSFIFHLLNHLIQVRLSSVTSNFFRSFGNARATHHILGNSYYVQLLLNIRAQSHIESGRGWEARKRESEKKRMRKCAKYRHLLKWHFFDSYPNPNPISVSVEN